MKKTWVVVLVLAAVSLASPGFSVTGSRQGCLAVINELNRPLQLYVQGSSQDTLGPWIVPPKTNRVLTGRSAKVGAVVSEQTMVWAITDAKSYPKTSLKADRSANYIAGVKRKDCAASGLWAKRFR
jgi:hypothetical protein